MEYLRYFTAQTVEDLRHQIAANLDWYYSPSGSLPEAAVSGGFRESRVKGLAISDRLEVNGQSPSSTDIVNALVVFEALGELTPHQASMERLWTWLCHHECPQYVADRWLGERPEEEDGAARKVRNHFFAVGNRALIRDNGVSRLWWLGKIAHDTDPDDPRRFLEILLHRQDVRSALIERPAVSMNRKVLGTIYRVMQEHWDGDRELFKRESFRNWMIALNRRGGVVLLDAMGEKELYQLVSQEAETALFD